MTTRIAICVAVLIWYVTVQRLLLRLFDNNQGRRPDRFDLFASYAIAVPLTILSVMVASFVWFVIIPWILFGGSWP